MTSVLRRAVAPFAAVTALVATLSACGTGPSQVNSAVIIDDHAISVDEVQGLIDKVVKEPAARPLAQQHKLDLVAREAVTQLVTHELITEIAREENLRVDPEQLANLREQNPLEQELPTDGSAPAEQLVPLLVNRARGFDAYANDNLLLVELAKKYVGHTQASVNLVGFTDFDKAKALAEKVAARPSDGADLMQSAGADGQPQLGVDTGSGVDAMQLLLPDNSVLVVNVPSDGQSTGGYFVVQVLSTSASTESSSEIDLDQLEPNQLLQVAQYAKYLLRQQLNNESIRLSPRYGAWNMAELKAVPKPEADIAGVLLLPKTEKP